MNGTFRTSHRLCVQIRREVIPMALISLSNSTGCGVSFQFIVGSLFATTEAASKSFLMGRRSHMTVTACALLTCIKAGWQSVWPGYPVDNQKHKVGKLINLRSNRVTLFQLEGQVIIPHYPKSSHARNLIAECWIAHSHKLCDQGSKNHQRQSYWKVPKYFYLV